MKLKSIFISLLIGSSAQFAVASDLDDAINFLNEKLKACQFWIGGDLGGFRKQENYLQEIAGVNLVRKSERFLILNTLEPHGPISNSEHEVALNKLSYPVETEVHRGKLSPSDPPKYWINFRCSNGEKCIKSKRFFVENRIIKDQKTSSESEAFVSLCSESDMNRAAKALEDAIRLSGGKTSKY